MKKKKVTQANEKTLAWSAPEFQYIHNSVNWYWIVATIGLLFTIGAIVAGNWSFAILLSLSTFMLMVLSTMRPKMINTSLNKKQIIINSKGYSLKSFDSYRIDEERDKLLLRSKKIYHPLTVVPLPHDAPKSKIETLLDEETDLELDEELSEPLLDILMHRFGF